MQTFTAIQRALLDARDDQAKMAIELDDSTPLRYCTGADPIQISSDWYDPHQMKFNKIALTDPRTSKTTVKLDDMDKVIRTQWYSTKLDASATVFWFLRNDDGTWENVLTVEWSVEEGSYDRNGNFFVSLSAAAGSRPRAGGAIGTRSEFPYAPEPGEAMSLGDSGGGITFKSGISLPPPPPGGQQRAYNPVGSSTDGDSRLTTTVPDTGGSGPTIPRPPGTTTQPGGSGTS